MSIDLAGVYRIPVVEKAVFEGKLCHSWHVHLDLGSKRDRNRQLLGSIPPMQMLAVDAVDDG